MIPKVIHYCWFGRGEKSPLIKKCIKSWHKYCPDYEIIEWNEDNFDVNCNAFVKEAYECKKWAFVSDYARLWILYNYGGVYMDTDQELIKPIDQFMDKKGFIGFLDDKNISAGIIGVESNLSIINEFLNHYENLRFKVNDKFNINPNTNFMTNVLLKHGLIVNDNYQEIAQLCIYPQTVFCPTSCISNEKKYSADTVGIHHWAMSWRKPSEIRTFKRVKSHQSWWYRLYENVKILPQKTVRIILGDDRVEKIKSKLKSR